VSKKNSRTTCMAIGKTLVLLLVFSLSAWSRVFVHWSIPELPPANSLGVSDIVFSWKEGISPVLAAARKQGYRVYVEVPIRQAGTAAEQAAKVGCAGVILDVSESESNSSESDVRNLRSTYSHLRFLMLNPNGKQPDMRGSLIIKRGSVLEVSSPTAQPWIDTNLALIKVEQRSRHGQVPLYTFSWTNQEQQRTPTADDYSLAVAEAGAFHADLVLTLDEALQRGLSHRDADAWALWSQALAVHRFSRGASPESSEPAANVAVVVDHLEADDEVLNLLSRHNIPFQVFLVSDLKAAELQHFDVLVVFAKPDEETGQRISSLATRGTTVVVVDAHGTFSWQGSQPVQLNEHTTSYVVGSGKVLELSEPVTDPETFAQDIRRLLGKHNALLSLWNGLTTIAVPYKDRRGRVTALELVNYALDPVRVQVQLKGSFSSIRYESPEHGCCESLVPIKHDGFTEFVIPELRIAGRVRMESQ
jgi:hypothetical protein